MHIPDGVLSPPVLAAGVIATALGTYAGLRKLDYEDVPRVGVIAAALFLASLMHVPLGPGSVHLVLNGIAGLLLGWSVFPAFLVALLLQLLLFGFGGLTSLGVNTFNMAAPGVLAYLLFRNFLRTNGIWSFAFGAAGSAIGIVGSAVILFSTLLLSGSEFLQTARIVLLAHVPIVIIEGIVGGFCISYLRRVRPEMLSLDTQSH